MDNRGTGQSSPLVGATSIREMADDALSVLDALGWERAHLVGHSMGGVIAQELALGAPTRVRSLALLSTVADGRTVTRVTPRMLWLGIRGRIGTRRMRRRAALEMILPASLLHRADVSVLAAEYGRLFGRDLAVLPPVVMAQLRALGAHDTTARLAELAGIPTLVVSGGEDCVTRAEFGEALARGIPGARYVEIPDAGHAVPIHDAARINRLLAEHWAAGPA